MILSRTKYTIWHACLWALHIANALDYLHRGKLHRYMHRDVRAPNILLTNLCRVAKLADFGLSKEFNGIRKLHSANVGNSLYTPSEFKGICYV